MSVGGFTHLHLHSEYSLLDGAISFKKLLTRCKELDMGAVAVTDHGNMFGAVEFYTKARAAHIKPIIGIEAYLAPGSRTDRTKSSISDAAYHLILLAENNAGYRNLLNLASIGYTEGFYYRPRIDKEVLSSFDPGITFPNTPNLLLVGWLSVIRQKGRGQCASCPSKLKPFLSFPPFQDSVEHATNKTVSTSDPIKDHNLARLRDVELALTIDDSAP